MAEATAEAIAAQQTLIVEAGTGTGKTLAYLLPALQSGKRVIISTGTRHLQDQLYGKDLPVVREALSIPVKTALLKGRSNYLCWHRLETANSEGRRLTRPQLHELGEIQAWSKRTRSGDIAELGDVPEDSVVWPRVTSSTENCLGQECEYHLLFADMVLREEGFGELLPGADAFIIDEAHQLPDVASVFFGTTLSSHQLRELARDTRTEHLREAGDMQDLPEAAQQLEGLLQRLRLELGTTDRRAAWSEVSGKQGLQELLDELAECLRVLVDWLVLAAERGKGLESCRARAVLLGERLTLLLAHSSGEYIHWFETHRNSFRLNLTPLNIADVFRTHLESLPSAWVFTSATLAVADSFKHFSMQLGIDDARQLKLDSPFDYQRNALLYLPDGPRPLWPVRVRSLRQARAGPFCCLPVTVPCSPPPNSCRICLTIPCWSRVPHRDVNCWIVFVISAMPCCWVPAVSGRVLMCAVRPCPVS